MKLLLYSHVFLSAVCIYNVSLSLVAVAAARGGGDVGVRQPGARHERSAESCSVRRIQQDRDHRTVRRLHVSRLSADSDQLCFAGSRHTLQTHCSYLLFPFNKLQNTHLQNFCPPWNRLIPECGRSYSQARNDSYPCQLLT